MKECTIPCQAVQSLLRLCARPLRGDLGSPYGENRTRRFAHDPLSHGAKETPLHSGSVVAR